MLKLLGTFFNLSRSNSSALDLKLAKSTFLAIFNVSTHVAFFKSKINFEKQWMSWLHSFRTNTKLQSHEKVCKNNDFCAIIAPSQRDNILQFNQYMKSDKTPCIIYADHESLIKKIDGSANSLEKFLTTKAG